ncbi:MAG TPA: hypothetical protein VIU12_34045 [Chryseolinea sp.]
MSTTGKIALGVGIASSALLAAWLLTGDRKEKTKLVVAKGARTLKGSLKSGKVVTEETGYYI